MGERMEILARIPALAEHQPLVVEEAPPPRGGSKRGFPRWLLDSRSIVALAVVSAAVWSWAAWNEQLRLAEQRRSARMAFQPPPIVKPETISP